IGERSPRSSRIVVVAPRGALRQGLLRMAPRLLPRTSFATLAARSAGIGASLALVLGAVGCGHPASRDECEEIFTHSAEIELRSQNVSDPKLIADRTAAVRAARGEELINRCMGKRITTRALECVRNATTSDQVDRCL